MSPSGDPLALPPVPPPAPGAHPRRDRALAVMFVTLIALPGLLLPALERLGVGGPLMAKLQSQPTLEMENRVAAPWPGLVATTRFPAQFERAFADNFFGRSVLLRAWHVILVQGLGVSSAPKVMLGGSGWLYFLGEDGKAFDRHYLGVQPVADADIAAVAAELERRAAFLATHGIAYVVTVVPDKHTIYPEHLPLWVPRPATPSPLDRLNDALRLQGVRVVDLRPPLLAAKQRERIYFKTDSHWTLAGASVGYDALMREVQRAVGVDKMPAIAPPARPPYVPGVDVYSGDLARLLGLKGYLTEPDFVPLGKVLADTASRCGKRIDTGADEDLEIYACNQPRLPRAVVLRDSMADLMIPLLSENFSRTVYVKSHRRLDPAAVLREKPDVVIEEMVERALLEPAAWPMPK